MCLCSQGIDDNYGVVDRVIHPCGLIDNDGGVSRGRGIHDASDGLETTAEALRIQVQQQRLRRRDDWLEELATTPEASTEKDEHIIGSKFHSKI